VRRRRRALLLVLAAVAVAVGIVVSLRRAGGASLLRQVLREMEAAGEAPTPEQWRATLPAVDDDLQRRIRAWANGVPEIEGGFPFEREAEEWLEGRRASPRAERLETFRPHAESIAALLADPRARISSLGFLRLPAASGPFEDVHEVLGFIIPFETARWFAAEALEEDRRDRALDALRRLFEAAAPVASLYDASLALSIAAVRDRARLVLAAGGALGGDRMDEFVAEPCEAERLFSDALSAERVLVWLPPARFVASGASVSSAFPTASPTSPAQWWRNVALPWLHGEEEFGRSLERRRLEEAWLRSPSGAPSLAGDDFVSPPFSSPRLLLPSLARLASEARFGHRAVRAAAVLAARARTTGAIPADAVEAAAALGPLSSLLDAGPWDPAIAYERLAADRFRLSADVTRPLPSWIPADELRRRAPSASAVVVETWHVEVRTPR
jgi:hypothetical protein